MTKQDKGRPRIKGLGRSDSFKVIDGVRYIQDEEADMRAVRNAVRMKSVRAAREQKDKWIINICKGLLAQHATDAQTIAFTLQRTGADVQENDVRNAMKTPEALALFQRVRAPSGRIEWILRKDQE